MITALILAAGQSKRMGQPKMLLPWGHTSVLGQVIETIQRAGVNEILVVTGGERERVEQVAAKYSVRSTHNPEYANGEMSASLQAGLSGLRDDPSVEAALICLGDQPQVEEGSVRAVVDRFIEKESGLVVPSYRMRRGHPWLVARPLWEELLSMRVSESPRDFLNRHAAQIEYVDVNTPSILADLDTPDDYLKSRP